MKKGKGKRNQLHFPKTIVSNAYFSKNNCLRNIILIMSSSRSLSSAQARRTVENYTPPLSVLNARGNPRKSIASRNMPSPPQPQFQPPQPQLQPQPQQQQQQFMYQQPEYNSMQSEYANMYQQPPPPMFAQQQQQQQQQSMFGTRQQPLYDIRAQPQPLLDIQQQQPRPGKIHINNAIGLITLRLSSLEEQLKTTNELGDFNSIISTLVSRIEVLEESIPKQIQELQKEIDYLKQITTLLNSEPPLEDETELQNSPQQFLVVPSEQDNQILSNV